MVAVCRRRAFWDVVIPDIIPAIRRKKTGQQCWKNSAPALFVLVLTGGCAGYARGAWEKERLDREEVSAREFTGTRVTLQGRIGKTEQGNGSLSLVLEDVKARVGKTDKRYGRVIVYVKDDGGGKHGRSGVDDGGGMMEGVERMAGKKEIPDCQTCFRE